MQRDLNPQAAELEVCLVDFTIAKRTNSSSSLSLHLGTSSLDELFVHPDVGGIAYAQGFFELVQGGTAPQKPDGEGVTENHRGDTWEANLIAALPEGVLERL